MKAGTRNAVARTFAVLALLLSCAFAPTAAFADTTACTVINALPYTITTPGIYCMGGPMSTSTGALAAIQVNASNVTIDCNNQELLYTGEGGTTAGIRANARTDLEIRNCRLVNFFRAINIMTANRRIWVHDNQISGARSAGIAVTGKENVVENNVVTESPGNDGILMDVPVDSSALVRNNVVRTLNGVGTTLVGINITGEGRAFLRDNVVRDIGTPTTNTATAIRTGAGPGLTPSPLVIWNGGLFAGVTANSKAVQALPGTAKSVCVGGGLFGYGPTANAGCY
jgi:hypothetical protein